MKKQEIEAREIVIKMQFQKEPLMFEQAKQCALTAVDLTIKSLKTTLGHLELRLLDAQEYLKDIQYWEEIKQEIEKL